MLTGKLGARDSGFAPKRNIHWQHKLHSIRAFHSMSTPERQQNRNGVVIRASESDAKLDQRLQADVEDTHNGNGSPILEPESVSIDNKSSVARACSQAVDGLDKLLSSDEPQSQPLRHRSKALRALDLAGRLVMVKLPAKELAGSNHSC